MKRIRKKQVVVGLAILFVLGLIASWISGGLLCAPSRRKSDPVPANLKVEDVTIPSSSGSRLRGWFFPVAEPNAPVVILMHGVRGCGGDMFERARFFHEAGYAALSFDFQAHGESPGKEITFGYVESKDAQSVVRYVHSRQPNSKIGVLGVSMGGAAALLADPRLDVNSMVLESVYPDIVHATEDRIIMRLGPAGKFLAPLLTCQLQMRLGIGVEQLRPIDGAAKSTVPKFFLAGTVDRETPVPESKALFAAAAEPKQLWLVEGARHENLYAFARQEYKKRVLAFLAKTLGTENEHR